MGELLADIAFEASGACATPRTYDVVALPVPVSYNHWGDFDPQGRLFVLRSDLLELLRQVERNLENATFDAFRPVLARTTENVTAAREAVAKHDLASAATWLANLQEATPLDVSHAAGFDIASLVPDPSNPQVGFIGRYDVADLARPLVIRAHLGDCVAVSLTNLLPEPVSMHFHAAATKPGQGMVLGTNQPDIVLPGGEGTYVVYLPPLRGLEGAHYFHSHADARFQTRHGLFGALVAEPPGAAWKDPADASRTLASGPEAIIDMAGGDRDFREYVVLYHDEVSVLNHTLKAPPIVNPDGGEYGPGTKGINLRHEPFMDRFLHVDALKGKGLVERSHDKSQAYGSYAHGDPATFVPRAYVGDPSKFRLVNAGPGQHHVHHLHGGGDRWRASPVADDTQFDDGFVKVPPEDKVRSKSERVDVQNIGPGESFNAEIEGGAGGVQQGVGDFLYHCHIVEHYVSGMWGFWRVYNTRQPDLAELPDLRGRVAPAVSSIELAGKTLADGTILDAANLEAFIEEQLPPRGERATPDDASVWNWMKEDQADGVPLYRGEPEDDVAWPNYTPATGERPVILFNPLDGRLAFPLLRPHLSERPPFAPGHGPAPYLGPTLDAAHPRGLCPDEVDRHYNVTALPVNVTYNADQYDQNGQVFALAEDVAPILAGTKPPRNLVLRANQGDCVEIIFASLLDAPSSKVNMHIHLVQFDVQASDGVVTGFNYEQSLRPAQRTSEELLVAPSDPTMLSVDHGERFQTNTTIAVGLGGPNVEVAKVKDSGPGFVELWAPLQKTHVAGELVGSEFVRYRWYADVELGLVYWHDHVDGLNSWRHGLFGALVVEPAATTWCDPKAARPGPGICPEIREGPVADIVHKTDAQRSFRELVLEFQDRACVEPLDEDGNQPGCTGASSNPRPPVRNFEVAGFNLRSEPLYRRNETYPLSSEVLLPNGSEQDDPFAGAFEAYAGDPVVLRLLYAGQASSTGVGTFSITGHRFPLETLSEGSPQRAALSLGISSQHNLRLDCGAGSCGQLPGDYLYAMAQPDSFDRGAWGILRVHDPARGVTEGLHPLPGFVRPVPPLDLAALRARAAVGDTERTYAIAAERRLLAQGEALPEAANVRLDLLDEVSGLPGGSGIEALPKGDLRRTLRTLEFYTIDDGLVESHVTPLVVRAETGDLIRLEFANHLPHAASLHVSMVQPLTIEDLGVAVGRNTPEASVLGPNGARVLHVVADAPLGAAYFTSYGQLQRGPKGLGSQSLAANPALEGLYGALVVEPVGSTFSPAVGPASLLHVPVEGQGLVQAKEFVLLYASDDPMFEASVMPYFGSVQDVVSVNYRSQRLPVGLQQRLGDVTAAGLVAADDLAEALEGAQVALQEEFRDLLRDIEPASEGDIALCDLEPTQCGNAPAVEVRNPLNPFLHSSFLAGDPETPLLEVGRGEPFVVRALGGAGDQLQVHSLTGHWWARDPGLRDCWLDLTACPSSLVDAETLGPGEASNAWIGAAGPGGAGDYLWASHREAFHDAGAWGLLRVRDCPILESPLGFVPPTSVGPLDRITTAATGTLCQAEAKAAQHLWTVVDGEGEKAP